MKTNQEESLPIMPSKQTNDVIDNIEELVNEIKLNLRLKAAPTSSVPLNSASEESSATSTTSIALTASVTDAPNVYSNKCQPPLQTNQDQYQQNQLHHPQQHIIKKQRSRPSPYHIPSRSWSEPAIFGPSKRLLGSKKNDENNIEDPYEMLQNLIKSNSLVKEAVRRLQLTSTSTYSRKQRYFYDSDEETTRSPALVMMCQLES